MKLLLDTHVVLWTIVEDGRLPGWAYTMMEENADDCFFSVASVWEAAIKNSIPGKSLGISGVNFRREALSIGFKELQVTGEHALGVETLPFHHRDPFDRMLVAQAIAEGCILVTHDGDIAKYGAFVRLV